MSRGCTTSCAKVGLCRLPILSRSTGATSSYHIRSPVQRGRHCEPFCRRKTGTRNSSVFILTTRMTCSSCVCKGYSQKMIECLLCSSWTGTRPVRERSHKSPQRRRASQKYPQIGLLTRGLRVENPSTAVPSCSRFYGSPSSNMNQALRPGLVIGTARDGACFESWKMGRRRLR